MKLPPIPDNRLKRNAAQGFTSLSREILGAEWSVIGNGWKFQG